MFSHSPLLDTFTELECSPIDIFVCLLIYVWIPVMFLKHSNKNMICWLLCDIIKIPILPWNTEIKVILLRPQTCWLYEKILNIEGISLSAHLEASWEMLYTVRFIGVHYDWFNNSLVSSQTKQMVEQNDGTLNYILRFIVLSSSS